MTQYKIMRRDAYDADADGIADEAEAVPVVAEFPGSPTAGQMVQKDGKLYMAV